MCGMPSIWSDLQVMLGFEFRPTFWVNIYNRVRLLEFPGSTDEDR